MVAINHYSKEDDGTVKLSENFSVNEFACKDGSDPIFIAPRLVEILQTIHSNFGQPVMIHSAYRTPLHNAKVGGARKSQHCYGIAADIVVRDVSPSEVAEFAETLLGDSGGIGRYAEFTHIDVREEKARWNG